MSMVPFIASVVARSIFLAMRAARIARQKAPQLATMAGIALVVSALVAMCAFRAFAPDVVAPQETEAGILGTFITANGTLANDWQLAGPAGPGLFDDGGALSTFANETLAGAPGSGALAFGNMTGGTTLPTGAVSWTAAAGKALTCSAKASSSVNTTTGTMTLDGPTVSVGPSTATVINIGNNATHDPTINIGDQSAASAQTISIGGSAVTLGAGTSSTSTWATTRLALENGIIQWGSFGGPQGNLSLTATLIGINGQLTLTTTSALACSTGGTVVVPTESAFPVTSSTLSSNCILDFTTNSQSGWTAFLDMSGVTVGATFGVVFKNGTTSSTTYTTSSVFSGTLATVMITGTNSLAVNW